MKSLSQYIQEHLYIGTPFNIIPNPQRTGISNNLLPYHTDYNVMIYSGGRFLPLNNLFYTARFNGYCVHGDCRETIQGTGTPASSVNDITLHVCDQLRNNFHRHLPKGGQELPGIPHVYPFLTGYDVDFMTKWYEESYKLPWSGFGEIIYYNPKRRTYESEVPMYAGKTPLTPIPELMAFSDENPRHPIVQIHYWIGNDEAFEDLLRWARQYPESNIILCHGGYEEGDDVQDWLVKAGRIAETDNIRVEVSWTLLDMLYNSRDWIFDALPVGNYVYGTDATPHMIKDGRDLDLVVDRLVQVSSLLNNSRLVQPHPSHSIYPEYQVPNTGK